MLYAYKPIPGGLHPLHPVSGSLAEEAEAAVALPAEAIWLDLHRPLDAQIAAVSALGVSVPSLDDMEEIEISNRLFQQDGTDYMTVVVPGSDAQGNPTAGPVTFMLSPQRLITVRHHAPRPFETYPTRAGRGAAGCSTPEHVFLGLVEEIIGRQADVLESVGKALDGASRRTFGSQTAASPAELRATLQEVGQQGEILNRVRLAVMTLERALAFFGTQKRDKPVETLVKAMTRDLAALAVHADFLSNRVSLAVDAVLGLINLAQNATARIMSIVATLFLPPTLVASAYGMNIEDMPMQHAVWGYPAVLGLMIASGLGTYLFFKWRRWL
ncbi:MAG: magnesium transporter CorA family protein [Roseivivax sp.]|nr:magnesium transporter CorA family protein [Roseivivax sp.]